jgi:hypothetical protein
MAQTQWALIAAEISSQHCFYLGFIHPSVEISMPRYHINFTDKLAFEICRQLGTTRSS